MFATLSSEVSMSRKRSSAQWDIDPQSGLTLKGNCHINKNPIVIVPGHYIYCKRLFKVDYRSTVWVEGGLYTGVETLP